MGDQIDSALESMSPEAMVAATHAACMATLRIHLEQHLQAHPASSYEDWIAAVHPENATAQGIDHRFYMEQSEHRKLWNGAVDALRQVASTNKVAECNRAEEDSMKELLQD